MKTTKTNAFLILFISIFFLVQTVYGQNSDFEKFVTKTSIPFTMPDGIELMTNVYLPITQETLSIPVDMGDLGILTIDIIPKGTQYIVYDSINGEPNPNPFQLPFIFSRTPYNKELGTMGGDMLPFLGYGYATQDVRGAYASQGVYIPMYSDSWNKNAYHPNISHSLDITDLSDHRNANKHEDGYHSLQYLIHEMKRNYDIDKDGNLEEFTSCNGSVGMIGVSALGNVQYQLAASHKINPEEPGLKCLMPIAATNEHYRYTGVQNGVFRQVLVAGWLGNQMLTILNDDLIDEDNSINNAIHTSSDFGMTDKYAVADKAINHFIAYQPDGSACGYYPNSILRSDWDASFAPVDENGEGKASGTYSRYSNMEVPIYHLTGWWDIFIDGQIATYRLLMDNLSDTYNNKSMQKLVIGPWAHQTIGTQATGDMLYRDNVSKYIFDVSQIEDGGIDQFVDSELFTWLRSNLNYQDKQMIGEPKFYIPESKTWKTLNAFTKIRVPSQDYTVDLFDFLKFATGQSELPNVKYEVDVFGIQQEQSIDVPKISEPMFDFPPINKQPEFVDFTQIPNVRFYIPGPIDDGVLENQELGNYWKVAETFPLTSGIINRKLYFTPSKQLQKTLPEEEGTLQYMHDPDNPVMTAGGANFIITTLDGNRYNQGQMDLTSNEFRTTSLNRPDVIAFTSTTILDSLCIIGHPVMTLYAKSEPVGVGEGETDTDFFVRILDVYPDGREFFVVEGAVNARARNYAKQLVTGDEDPEIPFTNINIGQTYEFQFQLMPIAYTFGKNHKIKILISSSNYPRYQVNPNIPIENGEFFRRLPNEDKIYNYKGEEFTARVAGQTLMFSSEYPTNIELPVYGDFTTSISEKLNKSDFRAQEQFLIYPNPTKQWVYITGESDSTYNLQLMNGLGKTIKSIQFEKQTVIDLQNISKGLYFINIENKKTKERRVKKLIIQE